MAGEHSALLTTCLGMGYSGSNYPKGQGQRLCPNASSSEPMHEVDLKRMELVQWCFLVFSYMYSLGFSILFLFSYFLNISLGLWKIGALEYRF